jgi:hypothetical protein
MAQIQGGSQYTQAVAITPNDVTAVYGLGFVVGVGGTVTFKPGGPLSNNANVQITAVAGFIYPIEFSLIAAAGTAATGIVGLS